MVFILKFNKFLLISVFLLTIISLGVVSASEESNMTENFVEADDASLGSSVDDLSIDSDETVDDNVNDVEEDVLGQSEGDLQTSDSNQDSSLSDDDEEWFEINSEEDMFIYFDEAGVLRDDYMDKNIKMVGTFDNLNEKMDVSFLCFICPKVDGSEAIFKNTVLYFNSDDMIVNGITSIYDCEIVEGELGDPFVICGCGINLFITNVNVTVNSETSYDGIVSAIVFRDISGDDDPVNFENITINFNVKNNGEGEVYPVYLGSCYNYNLSNCFINASSNIDYCVKAYESEGLIANNVFYAANCGNDAVKCEGGDLPTVENNVPNIANIRVNVDDINYGQPAIFDITLNEKATGEVTVIVDDKKQSAELADGKATIIVKDLSAGVKNVKIVYSGDNYYEESSKEISFNISKVEAPITVNVPQTNVKVGKTVEISLSTLKGVSGNVVVYVNDDLKNNFTVSKYGKIGTVKLSNLNPGIYTVNITYPGDNNYFGHNETVIINVTDYNAPQWSQDTPNSPYISDSNGLVLWNVSIDGNVCGNLAIDSEGNVYVASNSGVYSYDNKGNLRWSYTPWGADPFGGITICRDVIIAPRSGDTLHFINQNDGSKYGSSNIYQASSKFAPIVDSKANIYITGDYQYGVGNYNLIIIPYESWEYGGSITTIDLGKDEPTSSPIFINDDLVGINTKNGLKLVDISSKTIVGIIGDVNSHINPVIADGIIYCCEDNSIKAVSVENQVLWKSNVSGGLGNNLVVIDTFIYSVNSQGVLYKYDLNDQGKEYLVYNITKKVSSNILVDENKVLYFTTDDGTFYAVDSEGKVLAKANIGTSAVGNYAMDKNGVIYFCNEDNLFAVGTSPKADADLKVNFKDIDYGNNEIITVTCEDYASGNVSILINGIEYSSEIIDGQAKFNISDLSSGKYELNVNYSGDRRFSSCSYPIAFNVNKIPSSVQINVGPQYFAGDSFEIAVLNNTGVAVSINNESYDVVDGKVVVDTTKLGVGNYIVVAKISENDNYLANETSATFEISKKEFNSTDDLISLPSSSEAVTNPSFSINLPSDATGNLTVIVNGKEYTKELVNGSATVGINDLPAGKYDAIIKYSGDSKYAPITKNTSLTIKEIQSKKTVKVASKITAKKKTFKANKKVKKYTITLKSKGKPIKKVWVTLKIKGKKLLKAKTNAKGKATFKIKKLTKKGKYKAVIKFKGNKYYKPATKKVKITVKK